MQWYLTLIIGLVLIVVGYTTIDQPITLYFSKMPSEVAYCANHFSWLIAPDTHLVAWPILFFCFFCLLRKKKANKLLLFIVAVAVTLLAVDLIKVLLGRARPHEWLTNGIYGFTWLGMKQRFLSFPSGHACTIGAVMASLTCFRPRQRLLWLAIAFTLAFCRVVALEHFFSDIIAGIMIAFLLTQLLYKGLYESRRFEST